MSQKPALIFDFGGVLLDWNPKRLYNKYFDGDAIAIEKFLKEIDFSNWNFEQDKGRSFSDGVAELSQKFPQYAALIKAYDDEWEESITGPIQSTVDTLLPLKEKGYSLFGLTNWSDEKFQLVNKKYPFFNLFETILVSGAVKIAKPDPRIFQLMIEEIGRPAQECVFIDDSKINIETAHTAGFQVIHFTTSQQMMTDLEILTRDFV